MTWKLFNSKKEALEIVGGLSNSAKMPELSHGTPAAECGVGGKLREKPGSVCFGCYAMKGRCAMPKSVAAQYRRLDAMEHPLWVEAMVYLLRIDNVKYFRWFDTGDIPSKKLLLKIFDVCYDTPYTKHWLPTRERRIVEEAMEYMPANLVIRLSAPMIGGAPVTGPNTSKLFPNTSTVHSKGGKVYGRECPAKHNSNQCGDCRACWDKRVRNVSYEYH